MLTQSPDSNGDRGFVINLSSIYGLVGGRFIPSYAASKGGVTNLTRQIALDYAGDGIHINGICPGCKYSPQPFTIDLLSAIHPHCPSTILNKL